MVTIEVTWKCIGCWSANKHAHDGRYNRQVMYDDFGEIVQHIIQNPEHYVEMQLRDSTNDED